jgi:hypothetical protein
MSITLPPRVIEYENFDLQIDASRGRRFSVRVVASQAGEARGTMRLPYDAAALEEQLRNLQSAVLHSRVAATGVPSAAAPCVKEFGRALTDALFNGELGRVYNDSLLLASQAGKRLRIRLRCADPLLAALPWEFLFDGRQSQYMLLSHKLSVVRYLEMRAPKPVLDVTAPLRILAMIASPRGLPVLDVAREKRWLQKALHGLIADGLVQVTWLEGGTWRDLQQALRSGPWHVFHFIGHGGFDERAGEGTLTLVGEGGGPDTLRASEVGLLLEAQPELRLAMLNSCQGAEESRTNPHASTAAALVQAGIPAVIAMQYPIGDDAASEFSRSMYEALRDGVPVDAAVADARIAVSTALRGTLEWGTPVLFTRASDTVLFRLQPRVESREIGPYLLDPLPPQQPPPCPYPGMARFREEDAAYFCGRDEVAEELCSAVRRQSLTAVVGISGSGKSSVVFAGLVPRLRQEEGWIVLDCRPGERPLLALAATFVHTLDPQGSDTTELIDAEAMAAALKDGRLRLPTVVLRLLEKRRDVRRLLLIVDQFEELYTLCSEDAERQAFIDGLLALTQGVSDRGSGACAVVLTLRADFYGSALTHRSLAAALQTAGLNLGPMSPEELQRAIAGPAQQLGVRFEAGLIDRLAAEVRGGQGRLPLLQMALTQLWAQQHAGTMTHTAYEAMGGVQQALARQADTVFDRLPVEQQGRARGIFLQLVRPGEGAADTRRRATRDEIGTENWNLVAYLADARLLVTGVDQATKQDIVEIVHEALIDRWDRLRGWIDADRRLSHLAGASALGSAPVGGNQAR